MPKRPPKNGFYFFMLDFKEQQKKSGVNYANLAETAEAAGPVWKDAPPSVRAKFDEIAKKEKIKTRGTPMKLTSTGIPFAVIERQQKELADAEEAELKDVKNLVKLKTFNNSIFDEDIYLIDVNAFCKTGAEYLIGEMTVLRFNLNDGIIDNYHELINPGRIPVGYTSDVKIGCQELGLDMPDDSLPCSNFMQILANIIDYLKQQDRNAQSLPMMFTMPEKVPQVQDFILQMCSRAAEDDTLFRIYKLDQFFFTLINAIRKRSNEGLPKLSLATAQLKKDTFRYTPELACEHHEDLGMPTECTMSRTKRWAFTILDSCCPVADIAAKPGKHLPYDYDIDGIMTYKETTMARPATAFNSMPSSSVNTSYLDDSHSEYTANASLNSTRQSRRTPAPMRMPKTNYSETIRPAPELTEPSLPTLIAAGVGRGRGLASSLKNMKLDK